MTHYLKSIKECFTVVVMPSHMNYNSNPTQPVRRINQCYDVRISLHSQLFGKDVSSFQQLDST